MNGRKLFGFLRTLAIYYGKPGNMAAMERFYRPFVREGELCFDIGAHVGNRTAVWRRLGARVVAVDPHPLCQKYLQHRFGNDPEVVLVDGAIGRNPGTLELHINDWSPSISTLRGKDWQDRMNQLSRYEETWSRVRMVEVRTLESLIREFGLPSFCKLDVEGFEWEILSEVRTPLPAFSFEFLNPGLEHVEEILARTESWGNYLFQYSLRERHRFELRASTHKANLMRSLTSLGQEVISGDIYAFRQ